MAYRTIFTLTGTDLGDRDLRLVGAMCQEAGAHLAILVVKMAPPPPAGEFAAVISDVWLDERREDEERLAARAGAVKAALADLTAPFTVAVEYPEPAWAAEIIGRHARYADLTVLGSDLLETKSMKAKAVEGALFHSGKPLLLVPQGFAVSLSPRRVLVAWDASIEATRAVGDALDMLVAAREVHVVLVDPLKVQTGHGSQPDADIAAYLSRHGVAVAVERVPREGDAVSKILARRALDLGADMMVMGAYGHSRLRERIFGGVTQSMLDAPPLPLFMAR